MRKLAPAVVVTAFLAFTPAATAMPMSTHAVTHTRAGRTRSRRTRITLAVPDAGDVSYGVAQVRITDRASIGGRVGRHTIFRQRVGGLALAAHAVKWPRLRRDTHVYLVVGSGTGRGVRTIALFVTRRKTGSEIRRPGRVAIDIPNARPASGTYFGRGADRNGLAHIFHVRNIISTSVDNWARYVGALRAAHAIAAALRAKRVLPAALVDAKARVASGKHATGRIWKGGQRPSALALGMFRLIFGTLHDRSAFEAAKNSPLVPQFIARDLNNPRLAARWARVVSESPVAVPDKYAAAAAEEAKFENVRAPRISRHVVRIADAVNSDDQANAIVSAISHAPTPPGSVLHFVFDEVGTDEKPDAVAISAQDGSLDCTLADFDHVVGGKCAHFYSSGQTVTFHASAPGWTATNWAVIPADAGSCESAPGGGCTLDITNAEGVDTPTVEVTLEPSVAGFGTPGALSPSESVVVNEVGHGTVTSSPPGINCGSACSYFLLSGTSMTLTATPDPGYTFFSWQDCPQPTGNECVVSYTGSGSAVPVVNVTANFVPVAAPQGGGSSPPAGTTHTLTVATGGGGSGNVTSNPAGIDCTTRCAASHDYPDGQQVVLTSAADSGSTSVGFTGCDSSTLTTCTVTLGSDRTVRAVFGLAQYSCTCTYAFHNLVGSFGTATNPNASGPEGVSLAGGDVWVAETSNDKIDEFTPTGTSSLLTFGSSSIFDTPRQVVRDTYASLIDVSDSFNGRVGQFDSAGNHIKDFVGTFSLPRGIAVDQGSGTVAVADAGNNEILEFASDGTGTGLLSSYGSSSTPFNGPEGVAFDSNGFLWVADTQANKVEEFNQGGVLLTSWTVPSTDGLANPTGIATDPDGHVFLTSFSTDRVIEYTQGGSYVATIAGFGSANGQVNGPVTLAVDQTNGDLYVADEGNNRVQRFVVG